MANYEMSQMQMIDKNLQKIKFKQLVQATDKISQYNKWTQKSKNKILI